MPSRARLKVGMPASDIPSNKISPWSKRSCPQTQLNSVVLPAPLGPTRPTHSPGRTSKPMLLTAWIPPKDLLTPVSLRRGADSAIGVGGRDGACRAIPLRGSRTGEEQSLEALGATALLEFEHALRMLGVGQGTER